MPCRTSLNLADFAAFQISLSRRFAQRLSVSAVKESLTHSHQLRQIQNTLEPEPKRNLHDSCRPGACRLPQGRVRLLPRRVEDRRCIHRAELRVIEKVVEFPAELQAARFALDREILEKCQIPIVDSRAAYDA